MKSYLHPWLHLHSHNCDILKFHWTQNQLDAQQRIQNLIPPRNRLHTYKARMLATKCGNNWPNEKHLPTMAHCIKPRKSVERYHLKTEHRNKAGGTLLPHIRDVSGLNPVLEPDIRFTFLVVFLGRTTLLLKLRHNWPSLFWGVTRRRLVVGYRRSGIYSLSRNVRSQLST